MKNAKYFYVKYIIYSTDDFCQVSRYVVHYLLQLGAGFKKSDSQSCCEYSADTE